jgi:Leucine-rich repeat (LRR) protein/predicted MPP superfamily phosphohydrolase
MTTITWLHLSDLHACPTKTGWDANQVIKSLVDDLKDLQREYKLRPDFIFFTGDAAFGQLGDQPGESLQDQYKSVQQFLDEVRKAFRPELRPRDVYLVPGNHDVNREDIDETQTSWLRNPARKLPEVISMMQADKIQWHRFMERLEDYKLFLKMNGYSHLLTDDKNRLIYADEREVAGLRIGIAGLNSAWSCYGGEQDKGQLWSGGKYQVEDLRPLLSNVDFSIALIHHPGNWFVAREDPNVQRLLESVFEFVLHGHEHQGWVRTDSKTGFTTIWAGPCYEHSEKRNGFNLVQLDRESGEGRVWLREYKEVGRGWVASNIKTLAPQGIWTLDGLKWFQKFKSREDPTLTKAVDSKPEVGLKLPTPLYNVTGVSESEKSGVFEQRFHEAMVRKYDYLELFGADIPSESQRHSLSVAYVSLNLNQDEEEKAGDVAAPNGKKSQPVDKKKLPFIGARPVGEVFDHLSLSAGRLLLRGVAGGGKSTLLRWAAIQAAKFNLQDREALADEAEAAFTSPADLLAGDPRQTISEVRELNANWRTRVPFLIRLRDCPSGVLPRPKDWPALIAKELPDAPSEWIDSVLTSGRGLVLFDGVDEVPSQKREILAREIENVIGAYPENYWIVSTRPGAVNKGWLSKLDFLEARIEPMSLDDQDQFIDKWYSAVAAEIRSTPRRAENLDKLAASLKQELRDTPSLARLAIYPLLCAMICALYRERNQRLPETQAAICEDLCKMLLHRRERETPDLNLIHLPPDYRKLDYEHKKYIVAELAKFMVDKGISSLDENEADTIIELALKHFPDHAEANPQEMRRAFIERSGLLRPSGTDKIDFLHNTLKEYLAAGRFVAEDSYRLLALRADDDSWQPVILFAAALPTPGFASNLMRELLKAFPKSHLRQKQESKSTKTNKRDAAESRSKEFFVVRCRNAAFRLEPDLVRQVDNLAARLFPPNTIADAEVLSNLGEIVIPHLNPKQRGGARQKVACIRALRLIGGPKAKAVLKNYVPGKAKLVLAELLTAAVELKINVKVPGNSLDLSSTTTSNLSPLAPSPNLRTLNLSNTRIHDLSSVARLKGLRSLNLGVTPVEDLSPLLGLKELRFLDLHKARIDLNSLTKLKTLQGVRLSGSSYPRYGYYEVTYLYHYSEPFQDLESVIHSVNDPNFPRHLASHYQRYRQFRPYMRKRLHPLNRRSKLLANEFSSLSDSRLSSSALELLSGLLSNSRVDRALLDVLLQKPGAVERLIYYHPELLYYSYVGYDRDFIQQQLWPLAEESEGLYSPLTKLKELKVVDLSAAPIIDLSPLSPLWKLEALLLSDTMVGDLSPLSKLTGLKCLELSGTSVSDLSTISRLKNLRILDLSQTKIQDLSFLRSLKNLDLLNLYGSAVENFEPLFDLPSLRYLLIARPSRSDKAGLATKRSQLRNLRAHNKKLLIRES